MRLYISFAGNAWHDDLVSVTILSRIKLNPHAIILLKSIGLDRSESVLSMNCFTSYTARYATFYQGISKYKTKQRVQQTRTIIYSAKPKQSYHAIVLRMNANYTCTLRRDHSWVGPDQPQTDYQNGLRCALIHGLYTISLLLHLSTLLQIFSKYISEFRIILNFSNSAIPYSYSVILEILTVLILQFTK